MKAIYPNALKKANYITVLTSKYCQQYESYGFTWSQIEAPIKFVVGSLEYEINECDESSALKALLVRTCHVIFSNPLGINQEYLSQSLLTILDYFKSKEPWVKYTVTDRKGVPLPEKHKEEYLAFISTMTQAVVNEILACTFPASSYEDTLKLESKESALQRSTMFRENDHPDSKRARIEEASLGSH